MDKGANKIVRTDVPAARKTGFQNGQRTIIQMPQLDGDSQIWVGQAVMMLIRMAHENNLTYSDELKHCFNVELMSSILEELGVTPQEIMDLRTREEEEEK